jgi:hypothetical protein
MPAAQLHFATGITSDFFISLSKNATAFHFHYWSFVIASILSMGVIYILTDHLNLSSFYRFMAILAIIGLSATAFDFARMHHQAKQLTTKFVTAEPSTKNFILMQGLDRLDAYGIGFNLLGLFLIVLCFKILNTKIWPKYISFIGLFNGILLQFVLLGTFMKIGILIDIAAGLSGIILTPLLFIGIGFFYIKKSTQGENPGLCY